MLTACPLRFAIVAALAPIARLWGTGSPSLRAPVAQVFNLCVALSRIDTRAMNAAGSRCLTAGG